jgi:DNA-binding NarL/FixJ family response regulator
MKNNNLLIVEDDPFHRKFLEDQLISDAFSELKIHSFDNGQSAINWLKNHYASYAVVDLQMEGVNGIEVAKNLWQNCDTAAVVFWSNFSDPAYVRAITKIVPKFGNFGYLLKTSSPAKLIRSLQGVFFDQQRVVDSEIQGILKRKNTRSNDLTTVEIEVINLVALGLTDKSIGIETGMSTRSVQTVIYNIFEKMQSYEADNLTEIQSMNRRARLVALAIINGEVNRDSLVDYEKRRLEKEIKKS